MSRRSSRPSLAGLLLDLAACSLPALLFIALIDYTAWANWWI
jgi:hypothetical protein